MQDSALPGDEDMEKGSRSQQARVLQKIVSNGSSSDLNWAQT